MKIRLMFVVLFFAIVASASAQDILRLLPKNNELKGWTRKGDPRIFESDKLWEYINGGADVYLDYGFTKVATVDLASEARSLVIDVYEMKTLEGAFGIYARERAPTYTFINAGAQGYQEGVALNFFQARYYVKIAAFSDDAETRQAAKKLADIVSVKIGVMKKMPSLLNLFPALGLQKNSETFEMKSYLEKPDLREAWTAKYTLKGKTVTAFICMTASPPTAIARAKTVKQGLASQGFMDKDFLPLKADLVITGKHRDAKDLVLMVKKNAIIGLHPATDRRAAVDFMKSLLSRVE